MTMTLTWCGNVCYKVCLKVRDYRGTLAHLQNGECLVSHVLVDIHKQIVTCNVIIAFRVDKVLMFSLILELIKNIKNWIWYE